MVAIKIGDVNAIHLPIVFGRFLIFHRWNLDNPPAVVRIYLISKLDKLVLDYQRREVQMLVEPRHEQFVSYVRTSHAAHRSILHPLL